MKNKDQVLIDNFLNKLYGDNSSENTTKNYRVDLNFFLKYINDKDVTLTITDVTLDHLEGYKAYLRDATYGKDNKHYSENTRVRRISSLKSFYEYLYDRDIIEKNPAKKLTVPKKESGTTPVFMTKNQAQKLLQATEGETHSLRDKTILKLFLITGVRLSELYNLNISDINETEVTIRKGKGNKTRKVWINKELLNDIQQYLKSRDDNQDALILSQKGGRMSRDAIQWTVDKYITKAKLDDNLSTHSLRHSNAFLMVQSGVPLNVIQELMGHSSLKTTQIYLHALDEDKKNVANIVGQLI